MVERALQRAITSLKRPNCAQMFFIYPGNRGAMLGGGTGMLAMMRHAGLSDRNLTLVADPYAENYMRGVSPDISDLPALLRWHKNLLEQSPHVTEVYHIGHSSGAYGALLFGHLLGAKKVWAFAPARPGSETAEAAKAFLREQLSAGSGVTEFVIYYSLANRRDCAFAAYLSQCPGVVLSPYTMPPPENAEKENVPGNLENYYHGKLLTTIINSGDMRQFMPPFRRTAGVDNAVST